MSLALKHQNTKAQSNFFIISGCSGSGKSTLLEALKNKGQLVVPEPGRRVVKEQIQANENGLPWQNMQRFAELCTDKAIEDFESHLNTDRPVFFDRSLIDIASAIDAFNLTMPLSLIDALSAMRYASTMFMSAPWQELFQTDAERQHSFQDALGEYEVLLPTYRAFGYEPKFLPQTFVEARVSFINATL